MRLRLLVASSLVAACAPSTPKLGGLELPAAASGLQVKLGSLVLLESASGKTGANAPAATRAGKAKIEAQYGAFKFTDLPGPWTESSTFTWDTVDSQTAIGSFKDAKKAVVARLTVTSLDTGELSISVKAQDPSTNRLSLAFACAEGDHFLGFGGQADAVDHHGHTVPIWTSEPGIGKNMANDDYPELWFLEGTRHASSYGLPTWFSSRGYVGVVETDRKSVFEVCSAQSDVFRVEVWDDHFTLWLFAGKSGTHPLSQATGRVLGRPVRPPPLAFAPWNDAITGAAEVRRVASVLRDAGVASSVLWTEDFRGGQAQGDAYRLVENWDLDPTLYPDAGLLAQELGRQGFGWMAYFNSFLVQGNPIFDEAQAGGHFVKDARGEPYLFSGPTFKPTGLADLSTPENREWVKGHLRKALDVGFVGWMADFGEWLPADAVLASGEDPLEAHNRYAREWASVSQEVLDERAADGVQRLFFARAGWLESNAVTPVVWGGDQRTDFEPDDGMPTVVPMAINLGLSGVSTFGSDLAGYQSATNPPATKEVFFRWTTLGALMPVMRTHHGTNPSQQWRFDSDAETLAHYKRWAGFHLQLFPFLDASSALAEAAGIPLITSLAVDFPDDERSWTLSDEYLLGGALLVAPVTQANATTRALHLPRGQWVSLDGKTRTTGPADVTVDAPLTEIPVFARAGSIVPRLPARVQTLLPAEAPVVDYDDVKRERSLLVVTGAAGRFGERDGSLYELTPVDGSTQWRDGGKAMPDCASATERGCVDRAGPNPVARLSAMGPLSFPGHVLAIDGSARTYDVEILDPK